MEEKYIQQATYFMGFEGTKLLPDLAWPITQTTFDFSWASNWQRYVIATQYFRPCLHQPISANNLTGV